MFSNKRWKKSCQSCTMRSARRNRLQYKLNIKKIEIEEILSVDEMITFITQQIWERKEKQERFYEMQDELMNNTDDAKKRINNKKLQSKVFSQNVNY